MIGYPCMITCDTNNKADKNSSGDIGKKRKYRKSGLGIVQKEQEIVKGLGGKRVLTAVSSNNPGQLRALITNGYITTHIEHVIVNHI